MRGVINVIGSLHVSCIVCSLGHDAGRATLGNFSTEKTEFYEEKVRSLI